MTDVNGKKFNVFFKYEINIFEKCKIKFWIKKTLYNFIYVSIDYIPKVLYISIQEYILKGRYIILNPINLIKSINRTQRAADKKYAS